MINEAIKLVSILEDEGIKGPRISFLSTRYEILVRVGGTRLTKHGGGCEQQMRTYMEDPMCKEASSLRCHVKEKQ